MLERKEENVVSEKLRQLGLKTIWYVLAFQQGQCTK